jgi:Na+-translocating ferredoxin:NAD+ oxidoreductase RnfE subunit
LIVTNCAVMGRAEAFAARQPPLRALLDGYRGFLPALLPMGAFVVLAFLIAGKNVIDARRPGAVAGAPATGATT